MDAAFGRDHGYCLSCNFISDASLPMASDGRACAATASAPKLTTTTAYSAGRLTTRVTGASSTTTATAGLLGWAVSSADVLGTVTRTDYDRLGQVVETTVELQGSASPDLTTDTAYDKDGKPTTVTVNETLYATQSYDPVTQRLTGSHT